MSIYADLRFDQAGGHGGNRALTQMVVIHATFNTASDENEARYAEHRPDQVSAHFYNDDDSVIQALDTDLIAYGCFSIGNSRSVQFELVGLDWDNDPPGPGAVSDATMRRIAPIVARVCAQYGIPIRKVGPAELAAGAKGICGHADVTRAWGQGDHLDPGPKFPWGRFLAYVLSHTTGDTMLWNNPAAIPKPVGGRDPDTLIVDLWSGEQLDSSAYAPGQLTGRQAQLTRIEATGRQAAADVAAVKAGLVTAQAAIAALADIVRAGGGHVDTAAIVARMDAAAADAAAERTGLHDQVEQLHTDLAAAHAEIHRLLTAGQAQAQASAKALTDPQS